MADNNPSIQPVVGMPSADLITYRFDNTDKKIESLDKKLDALNLNFATKEEVQEIYRRLDVQVWYWRAVFSGLFVVAAAAVASLINK